jgi:hypothetical protein
LAFPWPFEAATSGDAGEVRPDDIQAYSCQHQALKAHLAFAESQCILDF